MNSALSASPGLLARRLSPCTLTLPPKGTSALVVGALCALLLAPPTFAQEAAPQQQATLQPDRSALPLSLRAFLLDVPADLPQQHRANAEQAMRLRLGAAPTQDQPATPASRRATERTRAPLGNARFPAWNLPPRSAGNGMVYANLAYGQITDEFDEEGETRSIGQNTEFTASLRQAAALVEGLDPSAIPSNVTGTVQAPARLEGQVSTINVNLGGAFDVYSNNLFSVALGADFQASQQNFESDQLVVNVAEGTGSIPALGISGAPLSDLIAAINPDATLPDAVEITPDQSERVPASVESGFQTQALTLFTQAKTRFFSLRGGFQFDLGPDPNLAEGEREVSDRQNAILLGVTGNYPLSDRFRVYGGVDGWFTLENEEDNVTYDEGDSYAAQVGADFEIIPALALGAALTYRYRTEASGEIDGTEVEEVEGSGYHFGIAPYVNYAPAGLPLTLYLKGGVRDEYRDFSFSLAGENEFAPTAGATLGAVYRF